MLPRSLIATLMIVTHLGLAEAATEVLPLQHRDSAELLPTVQALLGQQGSVSAFENKLVVDASPERIAELRALLGQLDTEPRRLLISVDTRDSNFQDTRGGARLIRHGTDNREGGLLQVQATEGRAALVQLGHSVPLIQVGTDAYGRMLSDTEYRNVTQGFYVVPRLSGNTVHLQITTNNDRMSRERQDVVSIKSSDTTVSGKLDEWITVAGFNGRSRAGQPSNRQTYGTERQEDMTLRVKVQLIE